MIQAVEWGDVVKLDSRATLNSWTDAELIAKDFYLAKENGAYTPGNAKAASGGIAGAAYFNPIIQTDATTIFANPNNKVNSSPIMDIQTYASGSLGTAMYYDRSVYNDDAIHEVDSAYIGQAIKAYKLNSDAFTSALTDYNTAKTTYEASVKARKEDSSKELAKRPDMPTPRPPAYSGIQLNISGLSKATPDTWVTTVKGLTTEMDCVLQNKGMTNTAEPNLLLRDNTINYLPSWGGPTEPSPKTMQAGVGKAYGRLGGSALASAPAPFIWTTLDSTALPGMMVSIFPYNGDVVTNDAKPITISAKQVALASVDLWKAPTQPAAASAIVDGSTTLVASGIATLAVLSTMI